MRVPLSIRPLIDYSCREGIRKQGNTGLGTALSLIAPSHVVSFSSSLSPLLLSLSSPSLSPLSPLDSPLSPTQSKVHKEQRTKSLILATEERS